MVRKKGEKSIRDVLREREPKLYHSLEVLWQTAEEEIHPRQKSPDGHKTGTEHCQKVEDNLNKLIPDKDKLEKYKPIELFILSASACLHDVGKAVESKIEHGTISMVDIITHHDKYRLDEGQAVIVGKIAGAHDDDTKGASRNNYINYHLLKLHAR